MFFFAEWILGTLLMLLSDCLLPSAFCFWHSEIIGWAAGGTSGLQKLSLDMLMLMV